MSITQLPPAPSRTDPATFSTRADTFVAALPTFVTEANATAANVTAKENQSEASAAAAASSEAAAAASENQALEYRNEAVAASGAVLWVAGTSYAIGDGVVSPTNFKSYRDKVGGVSNTDPANDLARWLILEVSRLEAIATTKAVTAVDVFVYDTSKDSDGGAWRKRCQHTSWYNEPLNTATRGARREFPAVAVIVAEAAKITIYDADNLALPMWMAFNPVGAGFDSIIGGVASGQLKAISVLNGMMMVVGAPTGDTQGIDFISDRGARLLNGSSRGVFNGNVASRNARLGHTYGSSWLADSAPVSRAVNDVAMTVLPNAPIDAATGLPVPTIAVATAGGVSVINNDGTVADSTQTVAMLKGWLGDNNRLFYSDDSSDQVYYTDTYAADGFNSGGAHYDTDAAPYTLAGNVVAGVNGAFGHADGVTFLHENPTTPANGMVAYTTSTYNTGWMTGDIKGAFLSDTDNTDLVGGTDADRSVNANPLTVNGTITRTPVATGADLVGYSGFSASNYLEQPYNSALDFGTGDLCVMGWFYKGSSNSRNAIHRRQVDDLNNQGMFQILSGTDNRVAFTGNDTTGSGVIYLTTPTSIDPSSWVFVTATRSGSVGALYIDGKLVAVDGTAAGDITSPSSDATLVVGGRHDHGNSWDGSIALLRISATAPTAQQIAKIYNDEKVLFQENAQATLYGSSDSVTALAHDDATGLLHVGTSAGRSVFQGLRRVSNTTTAVGTAISASNNMIVEE